MPKLTKRAVDAAKPQDKDYFLWDDEVSGFGLRVLPSGKKSYLIQYRTGGRSRRVALGRHGTITADQARTRAKELLGTVAGGEDPAEEIGNRRRAPKVSEVCERFMTEHTKTRCKPSTQSEYQRSIDLFIIPAIGTRKITDIVRGDIARLQNSMKHIPYQANRTLGVLSVLFNLAEVWGLRPDGSSPCRHVKKFREEKRERYLSRDELKTLGEVLDAMEIEQAESRAAINAIRLLVLTGCRLREIQTLKWSYVYGSNLELPDTKTGARRVYLGPPAIDVLQKIERIPGNEYVITGKIEGQHLTDLQRPWRRIRKRAGLEDVRIHDLRHTFASLAVAKGLSLPIIGKLLGHRQVQTTARYAHLADDPVQASADIVTADITDALTNK